MKRCGAGRLQISADICTDCLHRKGAEEAAARLIEDGGEIQIKFHTGGFDHHAKRGVRLAGDLELVHDYGTQQRRLDFSELNAQPFLSRGACDPEAQSARYRQWRQANSKHAGDKQRAAKRRRNFLNRICVPLL